VKRSTWILLAGLAAAGIVLAASAVHVGGLKRQQAVTIKACDLAIARRREVAGTYGHEGQEGYFVPENDPRGAELARAEADCNDKMNHTPDDAEVAHVAGLFRLIAAIIAVLGALPWVWYFLLRRVAELRAAAGGNPPTG
jgi:hypothetical protein